MTHHRSKMNYSQAKMTHLNSNYVSQAMTHIRVTSYDTLP
jgi:hypothetical protein